MVLTSWSCPTFVAQLILRTPLLIPSVLLCSQRVWTLLWTNLVRAKLVPFLTYCVSPLLSPGRRISSTSGLPLLLSDTSQSLWWPTCCLEILPLMKLRVSTTRHMPSILQSSFLRRTPPWSTGRLVEIYMLAPRVPWMSLISIKQRQSLPSLPLAWCKIWEILLAFGMVHAWVGQKLLKRNKIKSFLRWPFLSFEHSYCKYKRNGKTSRPYVILIVRPPQQIIFSP